MKSTGIVRKIDELGRIVIPVEIRNDLNISIKDPIEIYTQGSSIIFKKHEDSCIFCNDNKNLINYNDKLICSSCLENLSDLKKE